MIIIMPLSRYLNGALYQVFLIDCSITEEALYKSL